MVQLYGLMIKKNRELEKIDKVGMDSVRVIGRRVGSIAKILKIGLANLEEPIGRAVLAGFSNQNELKEKIKKFYHR